MIGKPQTLNLQRKDNEREQYYHNDTDAGTEA